MRARRLVIAMGLAAMLLPAYAAPALAGPEWCDDGSPPPNDWGFRKTGAQSDVSATSWLRSTSWGFAPRPDDIRSAVRTLEGGVARGMATAIEHARER